MENNIQNNVNNSKQGNVQPNGNKDKKITIVLLIIVLILILGVGIGGGFLLGQRLINSKNETSNTSDNSVNKVENNENKTENKVENKTENTVNKTETNQVADNKSGEYTEQELVKMALDYYENKNNYRPGHAAAQKNEDGTYSIQLYDSFSDHNSTSDWYTVDAKTGVGTDIKGNKIDLKDKTKVQKSNNDASKVNDPYNIAVTEIKKCLKDGSWIANNVMMKSSVFNEPIKGKRKVTFMKVVNGNYSPMFVIQDYAEEDLSSQLFIVTYQNGKVVVNEMQKQHISHGGSNVDPNKAVIGTGFIHMGYYSDATYSIKSGKPELLVCTGKDPIDTYSEKYKFYKQIGNGERVDITEQEYNKIQEEEKNKYKFYPVGTELTDANVDEYVK